MLNDTDASLSMVVIVFDVVALYNAKREFIPGAAKNRVGNPDFLDGWCNTKGLGRIHFV